MSEKLEFIKGAVRPSVVWLSFGLLIYCIVSGTSVDNLVRWLIIAIIGEYFGERAVKRLREM
jgi:hypothetical protein